MNTILALSIALQIYGSIVAADRNGNNHYARSTSYGGKDLVFEQIQSKTFILRVPKSINGPNILHGQKVLSLSDGSFLLSIKNSSNEIIPDFVATVGLETNHLFHHELNLPIGLVGSQSQLHVVSSFKEAVRPWNVTGRELTLSGYPKALACPKDPEKTEYTLHWGSVRLCSGGFTISLVPEIPGGDNSQFLRFTGGN